MFANKIYLSDNYFVNNNGIEKFMRINPIFRGNIDNKPQTSFKSFSDIKIIPSINTAVRANCHVYPIVRHTV